MHYINFRLALRQTPTSRAEKKKVYYRCTDGTTAVAFVEKAKMYKIQIKELSGIKQKPYQSFMVVLKDIKHHRKRIYIKRKLNMNFKELVGNY